MSNRINQEREKELEPKRLEFAKNTLESLGYTVDVVSKKEIQFYHDGDLVRLFPYSGWFTGKSVIDGRGINKLLNQLKSK
ncbi:hypothetical protein K7A41_23360 [Sphingobacterium sp. InxBP1]|nr:hypothetical protein [Sphingobacterium sp. InxBP1]